jgi:uncharacterized protein YjiS (DUF1127 family)
MKQLFSRLVKHIIASREKRAEALVLEHLDLRTLKDIGMDGWRSPAGRHAAARQTQDALAWRAVLTPSTRGFQ